MHHVVWELLEIVSGQVQRLQVPAREQVANRLEAELVVGEVEDLQRVEVLLAKGRNLRDGVELKIQVL